jgi:hypothetical protein
MFSNLCFIQNAESVQISNTSQERVLAQIVFIGIQILTKSYIILQNIPQIFQKTPLSFTLFENESLGEVFFLKRKKKKSSTF